jgi:hypothetical protein
LIFFNRCSIFINFIQSTRISFSSIKFFFSEVKVSNPGNSADYSINDLSKNAEQAKVEATTNANLIGSNCSINDSTSSSIRADSDLNEYNDADTADLDIALSKIKEELRQLSLDDANDDLGDNDKSMLDNLGNVNYDAVDVSSYKIDEKSDECTTKVDNINNNSTGSGSRNIINKAYDDFYINLKKKLHAASLKEFSDIEHKYKSLKIADAPNNCAEVVEPSSDDDLYISPEEKFITKTFNEYLNEHLDFKELICKAEFKPKHRRLPIMHPVAVLLSGKFTRTPSIDPYTTVRTYGKQLIPSLAETIREEARP